MVGAELTCGLQNMRGFLGGHDERVLVERMG